MANEVIKKNQYYRVLSDVTSQIWDRISFWTHASDVHFDDNSSVQDNIGDLRGVVEVTLEEYNALPDTKFTDNKNYYITDAGGGGGAISSNCLYFENVTVDVSTFVSDTTLSGYSYKASIPLEGVTSKHVPYVSFNKDDRYSGIYSDYATTTNGAVNIYASSVPESLTIGYIKCVLN